MSKGPLFGRPIGTAPGAATTTTPAPAAASAAAPATTPAPAAASAAAPATTPAPAAASAAAPATTPAPAATVENLKRQVLQLTSERDTARKERDSALAAERAAKEAQKRAEQAEAEAKKRAEQAEAEAKKRAEDLAKEAKRERGEALVKRIAAARLTTDETLRINEIGAQIAALQAELKGIIVNGEKRAAAEIGGMAALVDLDLG